MKLRDRVAVVTGASGAIGRAVAIGFAEEGADVVVHYGKSELEAEKVVADVRARGRTGVRVQADVSRPEEISRIARTAIERFGRIDVWANIAGADILTGEGAGLSDMEKLDRVLAVDLRGTVLCSWEAAKSLKDGGVILNTSWDYALSGMKGRQAELYGAAKGGILSFSKCLARSLAPRIRVNILAPGWIHTGFAEALDEETRRKITAPIPLGRFGFPEDVARAAVFLASPDSRYLTGQTLLVGGGEVM